MYQVVRTVETTKVVPFEKIVYRETPTSATVFAPKVSYQEPIQVYQTKYRSMQVVYVSVMLWVQNFVTHSRVYVRDSYIYLSE